MNIGAVSHSNLSFPVSRNDDGPTNTRGSDQKSAFTLRNLDITDSYASKDGFDPGDLHVTDHYVSDGSDKFELPDLYVTDGIASDPKDGFDPGDLYVIDHYVSNGDDKFEIPSRYVTDGFASASKNGGELKAQILEVTLTSLRLAAAQNSSKSGQAAWMFEALTRSQGQE